MGLVGAVHVRMQLRGIPAGAAACVADFHLHPSSLQVEILNLLLLLLLRPHVGAAAARPGAQWRRAAAAG
jgi:hypothetical protein